MFVGFEFVIADEQMRAAEKHGNVKGTAGLNQSRYLRDVLSPKENSENVSHWERVYAFASIGNERVWIPSNLIKTKSDLEDP